MCAQSDDPGRDFRGAGLYGLDNLIYMGTHQPALFKQLMLKTQVRQEVLHTL
jgi:engulfment and cell motility protein 2